MKNKLLLIIGAVIIALSAIITTYYYANNYLSKKMVSNYLTTRYQSTDYNNISERSETQKGYLDTAFIVPGNIFTNYEDDIKMFKENLFKSTITSSKLYIKKDKGNFKYIGVNLDVSFRSDLYKTWWQHTCYDLEFVLERVNMVKYKISFIKILSIENKTSEDGEEDLHLH